MAVDKQMFEDVKKRLNMMWEYDAKQGLNEMTLFSNNVEEAGDDDQQPADAADADPAAGGDPNAMGGADMGGGMPPMGGDPSMAGGDPNAMGGADMGGDPNAMGGDPSMAGGDPNADGGEVQTPEGFNPQDPSMMGGDPNAMGGADTEQPGDEVLDVTELTDKQDDIEDEIKEVGGKFEEVLKAIGSFEELIKANDEKLEDLKAEIERRNPTQIEKLGLQKEKSYPFSVSPDEYWKDKEATSNYSTEPDNNGVTQGQYVITAKDVDGDVNWKAIADSLDDKGFLYNQTLDKLFNL